MKNVFFLAAPGLARYGEEGRSHPSSGSAAAPAAALPAADPAIAAPAFFSGVPSLPGKNTEDIARCRGGTAATVGMP